MRQLGVFLIQSKLFIAFSALVLTLATQVQLGHGLVWNPYLLLVFFATFLVYNLTRLVVLQFYKMPLEHPSDQWVNQNKKFFYGTLTIAFIGLIMSFFLMKKGSLFFLIPLMIVVLFYALPFLKIKELNLNLRRVPFLKIFLIMMVWAFATVMLPVLQLEEYINWKTTVLLLIERLLFIGALAILFDIRDVVDDGKMGLRTIPSLIGEQKSLLLSKILLSVFLLVSFFNYWSHNFFYLLPAASISFLTVWYLINSSSIKLNPFYHALYLDGAILLHGLLIVFFYFYHCF